MPETIPLTDLRARFLEPEVRCDHEVTAEVKKLWKVELDLLEAFIAVCKKHNLHYMAFGGTLLGAVRHHGFIPWDDDIDVCMLREDYDRFLEIAPQELPDGLFLQTALSDPEYPYGFAKLRNSNTACIEKSRVLNHHCTNQGIFIDIFPMDPMYKDPVKREAISEEYRKLRWFYIDVHKRYFTQKYFRNNSRGGCANFLRYCRFLMQRIFFKPATFIKRLYFNLTGGNQAWSKRMDVTYLRLDKSQCEWIGPCAWQLFHKLENYYYPIELYNGKTQECPYEYLTISIPERYDEILQTTYGDWHRLVKGGQKHSALEIDCAKPFKELLVEKYGYSPRDYA